MQEPKDAPEGVKKNSVRFINKWKYVALILSLLIPLLIYWCGRNSYLGFYRTKTEGIAKTFMGASFLITVIFTFASYGKYFEEVNLEKQALFRWSLVAWVFTIIICILSFIPTKWPEFLWARHFRIFYWELASLILAIAFLLIDKKGCSVGLFSGMNLKHKELIMLLNWTIFFSIFFTMLLNEIISGKSWLTSSPKIENCESFSEGIVAGSISVQIIIANVLFIRLSDFLNDLSGGNSK